MGSAWQVLPGREEAELPERERQGEGKRRMETIWDQIMEALDAGLRGKWGRKSCGWSDTWDLTQAWHCMGGAGTGTFSRGRALRSHHHILG